MCSLRFIIFVLPLIFEKIHCRDFCEYSEVFENLKYYKTKTCYKSTLPVIAWTKTSTLKDCRQFARQRRGLAFNFSPQEASSYRNFSQNCQVLGCPETEKSVTLIVDVTFDYYSAYGNLNTTENATCIMYRGLFSLIEEKQNYTTSIEKCQNIGAYPANVLSEVRTNHLSQYINNTLNDWYKVAYIGLNDIQEEGTFRTINDSMLSCYRYRSWGPGHPRSKYKNEDCVVLDTEGMWRVVKCNAKLPVLCEFYLEKSDDENEVHNSICESKDTCTGKSTSVGINLYNNYTRIEKCSMIYDGFTNTSKVLNETKTS